MKKSKLFALLGILIVLGGLLYAGPSILQVYMGGTGATSFTAHGVLIGEGSAALAATGAGTSGQVLTSNGASADPTFQAAAGGAGGYATVDGDGTSVTQRTILNLISGSGVVVSCVDNSGATRTDCTLSSVSGPSNYGVPYNFIVDSTGSSFTSKSFTSTVSVVSGTFILFPCALFTNDGGTATLSASSSPAETWHTATSFFSSTWGGRIAAFWAVASSTGTYTFTCTSTASKPFWILGAYGINGASTIDVTNTNQGTGTTMLSGTLTTTHINDLAFIFAGTGGNDANASLQFGYNIQARSDIGSYLGVRQLGGAGSYVFTVTNANASWGNIVVALF